MCKEVRAEENYCPDHRVRLPKRGRIAVIAVPKPQMPASPELEDEPTRWISVNSILFATRHRPWPPPMTPWVMTQRWNDLLFLHYEVPPEMLRVLVPEALELDTYQRRAWLSISPFWMSHLRPPGIPSIPWISQFAELNVRTYVTYKGKPGVYFFSLDASHLSAVWGARIFYRLPYWHAKMKVKGRGKPVITYHSKRSHGPKPTELRLTYGPTAPSFRCRPGSLEYFLTERYCLYAATRKRLYRTDIHHLPWSLEPATAEIQHNTMTKTLGIALPSAPSLMHFSRALNVLVWAPERLR